MNFHIHHYLDYHAKHSPHNEAVSCLDEKLSYCELQKNANQLAHRLIEQGVKPGSRVGIYMDKCLEMATAIYGILKAGAVYVPLDPFAPVERLASIIDNCDIDILLSHNNKKKRLLKITPLTKNPLFIIGVDKLEQQLPDQQFHSQAWQWVYTHNNIANPEVDIVESDLAYIIYTSGSTGIPKGIMHTHYSCLSYVQRAVVELEIKAYDKLGNHCPLHFDISIFDWFATVVAGASIILIPDEYTKLPVSYCELIAKSQMTVLFTVPFALIQLAQCGAIEKQDMSHLRWISFGGEPMLVKHLYSIMQQLPGVVFDNVYGPAEVNACTHYLVKNLKQDASAVPIGKMYDYAQALIVDESNVPVNTNQIGELLVKSPTMMKGYWARPDLNENAFYHASAPVNSTNVKRELSDTYYRTGDLVKVDEEGLMWFIGRKDRQVKVRGYRIELDEIEAILVSHDNIEEAAVYTVAAEDKSTQLHASYTVKADAMITNRDMRKFLKSKLAHYAVPSEIDKVQVFPRTSSGKIDRLNLSKKATICP